MGLQAKAEIIVKTSLQIGGFFVLFISVRPVADELSDNPLTYRVRGGLSDIGCCGHRADKSDNVSALTIISH